MPVADEFVDLASLDVGPDEWEWLARSDPSAAGPSCPTCRGAGEFNSLAGRIPCDCDTQRMLHKHYLVAGIGELYQRLDFDDYQSDPRAMQDTVSWLGHHRESSETGVGLTFTGPWGTGKTLLAMLAAKCLVRLGYSVFACTFPQMIDMFTRTWGGSERDRDRFERKVIGSRFLVLDDVGKEMRGRSDLPAATFDHVLRQRIVSLRPTVLTTNMSQEELARGYGAAVLSLLMERSLVVAVEGEDWRDRSRSRTGAEMARRVRRAIA